MSFLEDVEDMLVVKHTNLKPYQYPYQYQLKRLTKEEVEEYYEKRRILKEENKEKENKKKDKIGFGGVFKRTKKDGTSLLTGNITFIDEDDEDKIKTIHVELYPNLDKRDGENKSGLKIKVYRYKKKGE